MKKNRRGVEGCIGVLFELSDHNDTKTTKKTGKNELKITICVGHSTLGLHCTVTNAVK